MNAKRDANFVNVAMGLSSVDGITPISLTVDPVTGRLRVHAIGCIGDGTPPTPRTSANRDDNRVPVIMGEYSDTGKAVPLTIASHDNGLMMGGL